MKRNHEKGQVLIEFALVAIVFFIVMFGIVEMERMILVYTTITDAARAGARYAIVHGNDRTGSGVDGPSGPTANPTEVVQTVRRIAGAGTLTTANVTVTVTYLDGTNSPGSRVSVLAAYPYNPLTVLPLTVTLSSRSEGVITF